MAKKVKRKKKIEKASKNNIFIVAIILIAAVALLYSVFSNTVAISNYGNNVNNPSKTTEGTITSTGGYCKSNYECFLTSCKGQSEDCINATQMSTYPKNCKTYSDWILGKQDTSRCSCYNHACTLK